MAMRKLYDLAYEIDGDNVTLEQDVGDGQVNAIYLQRLHLRHLAEELGLIALAGAQRQREVTILQRRIHTLTDKLYDLVNHSGRKDVRDRSSSGEYLIADIDSAFELAVEFATDLIGSPPACEVQEPESIKSVASVTTHSVTSLRHNAETKRNANAERQARYRQRKKADNGNCREIPPTGPRHQTPGG
jgi:hypothetical protein